MHIFKEHNFGVMVGNRSFSPDKPTLIFIHGAALSKQMWTAQVEGLSGEANTMALDLPGHKDSGGPVPDDMFEHASAVASFIREMKVPRPVLCGLSMGGAVALSLLLTRPDAFKSAILMHTGARLKVFPFIFDTIEKDYTQYLDLAVDFSTAETSDRAKIKTMMKAIAVAEADVALKDFTACDRFDVMGRLDGISAKVLVVTGDQDAITPPKYGAYLHQHINGAQFQSVPDAGHLSPLEKPDAVNAILRRFLIEECA